MKKTIIALSLAAMSLPALAQQKAPEPDFTFTGNVGLFSDYRFRGVSQTQKKEAIQGGVDFSHKSGIYLGIWGSNVSRWANLGGNKEIDFYGGYKGSLPADIGFDIGYISYTYPSNAANPTNETKEWYLGFSKGPVSYKYSKTTGNWFGIAESKGSDYHDLTLTLPITDTISFSAHAGKQDIAGSSQVNGGAFNPDFNDYSLGLGFDLGNGFTFGLKYVTVDFKDSRAKGTGGWFFFDNKSLGNDTVVVSIVKTF